MTHTTPVPKQIQPIFECPRRREVWELILPEDLSAGSKGNGRNRRQNLLSLGFPSALAICAVASRYSADAAIKLNLLPFRSRTNRAIMSSRNEMEGTPHLCTWRELV
ncbi:hypothetical protein DL93DRAFT_2074569 [Clavulina sp. PMI_390]|nr:hypothetical protein DL93DRAFT_2074569 [Clavulina sp. PMI_390]